MRRMHPLSYGIILSLLTALSPLAPVRADALPPPDFPYHDARPATLKAPPATHLRLETLNIVLEKTTLSQVQTHFSFGAIDERGDAAEHIYWLCYTFIDKTQGHRLWLISNGEFGGPQHEITAIAAELLDASSTATTDCPPVSPKYGRPSLDNGLWLGTSLETIIQYLGKPSVHDPRRLGFFYAGKLKLPSGGDGDRKAEAFDVTNDLAVQLDKGRVIRLWAAKTTSN